MLTLNMSVCSASTKPSGHIYSAPAFYANRGDLNGVIVGESHPGSRNHARNKNSFEMRNLDSAIYGCSRKMFHTEHYNHLITFTMHENANDFQKPTSMLGSVNVTSRLNSWLNCIFSASTVNLICGAQVFLHIRPAPFWLMKVHISDK